MKLWLIFFAGYFLGNFTRLICSLVTYRRRDRDDPRELFRSIERAERE